MSTSSGTTSAAMNGIRHETSSPRPYTILVEGNIGSGKTTFLDKFLDRQDEVELLAEPVDRWRNLGGRNLLDLMYSDPARHSFLFQSYVQLTMVEQHCRPAHKPVRIMERSLLRKSPLPTEKSSHSFKNLIHSVTILCISLKLSKLHY